MAKKKAQKKTTEGDEAPAVVDSEAPQGPDEKTSTPMLNDFNVEWVPIGKVKRYEKNPRVNDAAVALVAKSLKRFKFNQPIVVDTDHVIVAGDTRYQAAEKLGYTHVPILVADWMTPEEIKAYRIADNKTGEAANWNMELLTSEVEELQLADFDLSLMGFNQVELDDMLGVVPTFEPGTAGDQGRLDQLDPKPVTCPHCHKVFDLRNVEKENPDESETQSETDSQD